MKYLLKPIAWLIWFADEVMHIIAPQRQRCWYSHPVTTWERTYGFELGNGPVSRRFER